MSGRSLIKQVLKRTPLYSVYRGCMERKYRKGLVAQLGRWTEDDEHRRVFYTQFIEPGDLVFDVGANVGNRSKVFLGMNARTVAFEPQPFCSQILQAALGPRELFKLETCALGEKVGLAKMFVSDAHTISSMSREWINNVRQSGRFSEHNWDGSTDVQTETHDRMISKYGRPQFIKIDVEGYEHVVLEGLSQPVRALSFEFIGEHLASTLECIDKLSSLGKVMFRYSLGESMEWGPSPWSCDDDIKSQLRSLPRELGGDLYAKTEVSDDNFHEN